MQALWKPTPPHVLLISLMSIGLAVLTPGCVEDLLPSQTDAVTPIHLSVEPIHSDPHDPASASNNGEGNSESDSDGIGENDGDLESENTGEDSGEKRQEPGRKKPWASAYLASWEHNAGTPYTNWGSLTVDEIDWTAMTHLIYFAMNVGSDGNPGESLDPRDRYNFTTERFTDIVPAAHANETHILFSIGGAGNYNGFSAAIRRDHTRRRLIDTILKLIRQYGFDGVDIDMEPIRDEDVGYYTTFIHQLHSELAHIRTRQGQIPLLTAAINGQFKMFADLQSYFDQINLMTYDLSGPWQRWQAWHNSALYSTGIFFESTGGQMPSVDQWVQYAMKAGLEPEKIGIGIDFYGYIWNGVYEPLQGWNFLNPPTLEREGGGNPYREIAGRFDLTTRQWDERAQVPYLSLRNPDRFVSYDDDESIERKLDYVDANGLGGFIVWELSATHLPGYDAGQGWMNTSTRQGTPSDTDPLLAPIRKWLARYQMQN